MESKKPFLSTLALHGLRLEVRLGCHAEERQKPQYVRFDVKVRFTTLPLGCTSDSLSDTVCYAQLSDAIRKICHIQEYRLIEHLGWRAFVALKEIIPQSTQLWLKILKEKPPVADLQDGTSFCLGDWNEAG